MWLLGSDWLATPALHGSNTIIKFADDTTVLGLIKDNDERTTDIHGAAVERVSSFKFLGTHLSQDLTWMTNCSSLVRKAHQRLFFLRTLKKHHLSSAPPPPAITMKVS
ncbi:hypothetical protein D4764_22G0006370 [Takifugu flavidus]|uniref:Alkylated DNA repair protein AlkB homologue 8 N-terminal domain-containing protein n=1 Tax=Takifugu flavidus TaxID=433684 RepID=A0A5C6NG36_9TELE|nr:hypothetical protein D4764_22G0006370 [Takifugu flavidus]